ncbi:PLD nuclease N-terminal domain-containing protein [Timonella sp. A28]|uniref:PLD nuclease N-terminal domain-containing protein n=1 Tax=Timonella sp. A28 TaxID=3442640 RepID=UPI003EB9013D
MLRALAVIFLFALALYCIADILSSDEQRRGTAPKFMWILIVAFIPLLGPIIWLVFVNGRKNTASYSSGPSTPSTYSRGRNNFQSSGPVAPDDDPDFLWKLAAEQRRKREAEEKQQQSDKDSPADNEPENQGDDGNSTDHDSDKPSQN